MSLWQVDDAATRDLMTAYYRRLEAKCLSKLVAGRTTSVVALPGGIVGNPDAFDLVGTSCYSVWLSAKPEQHWARVNLQGDPRLNQERSSAVVRIAKIIAARSPQYQQANAVVDTSPRTAAEVAAEVVLSLSGKFRTRSIM